MWALILAVVGLVIRRHRSELQPLFAGATALAQGLEGSRLYFYNSWYMWVHPPLLFLSYGAFVASFAALVLTYLTTYLVPGAHSVA